uniref:Uncharacterized protein n=1 Tax=Cacopsylla melanoneura TaxID=428564 RepID=A0A8D8W918_9HEMI
MQIRCEIVDQQFLSFLFTFFVYHRAVQIQDKHFDSTTFPTFPQISWYIEEHCLKEQDKAHPLIIFVILDLIFSFYVTCHPRLNNILSNTSTQSVRYCER